MVAMLKPSMARTSIFDEARNCTVLCEDGKVKTFDDLLNKQNTMIKRTLVVFIRHFFCGNCQEYVRRLATDLAPSSLPSDLSIIIIGCGVPSLIASYSEITACPYPIYADPSTRLYQILGMQRSLSLGTRGPAYIRHSLASGMVKSIVQGLRRIPAGDVMQAGELDVNGGEFLFEQDCDSSSISGSSQDWKISWSHCMQNSRDHAEIDQVKRALKLIQAQEAVSQQQTPQLVSHRSDGSLRRSISRRKSWMIKAGGIARSTSLRRTAVQAT